MKAEIIIQKVIGYMFIMGGLIGCLESFGIWQSYLYAGNEYNDYILMGLVTIAGAYLVKVPNNIVSETVVNSDKTDKTDKKDMVIVPSIQTKVESPSEPAKKPISS